jgi:hypothetical protein
MFYLCFTYVLLMLKYISYNLLLIYLYFTYILLMIDLVFYLCFPYDHVYFL